MSQLSSIVIGAVIFASVVTGMWLFYSDLGRVNGATSTANFTQINTTGNITQKAKEIDVQLRDIVENFQITDIFDLATLFVFKVGGLLLASASAVIQIVANIPDLFPSVGLPGWFIAMVITITIILVIFAVVKIGTRVDV